MTTVTTGPRIPFPRVFFLVLSLVAAGIVVWGFSATYYSRPAELPPLSSLLFWHGALFTSWVVIFGIQSSLITANKRVMHRRLGILASVVAVLMLVFGSLAALDALQRGAVPIPGLDPRSFFAIPARSVVIFALLVGAGFWFRWQPDIHKRMMLLATFSILDAAIARIPLGFIVNGGPIAFYALQDLLVVACAAVDWRYNGRLHPAFLWGGLLIVLSGPLTLLLSGMPWWLAFADWCLELYT